MIMITEKKGDKIKYSIHICDICASKRQMKFEIFRMKRSRVRQKQSCAICNAPTNSAYGGIADSEKEAEQIKEQLT
jgi:hypothetical protein